MRRLLCVLAVILSPLPAHAAPITFDFAAGDVTGWYTFDTTTPGVHEIYDYMEGWDPVDAGTGYFGAITNWDVWVGDFWHAAGSDGDIHIAAGQAAYSGEAWYWADMRNDPGIDGTSIRLILDIMSPTETVVRNEELTNQVPEHGENIYIHQARLFDEWPRTSISRDEPLSSLSVRAPTRVPEPSTLFLLAVGIIGCAAKAWK